MAALGEQTQWALDLHVGHVQHHLRDDAEADAGFVAALADQHRLPYHRRDLSIEPAAGNLEAQARKLRYGALSDIADQIGADAVATAHHGDDQLETVLMRLIRGASLRGLAGMSDRRCLGSQQLIRPMLAFRRTDVLDFLGQIDQPWREDHTNADTSRWRARLRAEVLPVLYDLRPDAAAKAQQTTRQLRDADDLMSRLSRRIERKHVTLSQGGTHDLPRDVARRLPPVLLGQVIRQQCRAVGVPADALGARIIDRVSDAARDDSCETRRFTLAGGVCVAVSSETVTWRPPSA